MTASNPQPGGHAAATVVFVGAGPGARDLITVRGLHALQQAQVVLADALADPALREWAPQARWLDVGKRGYSASTAQARIDALLVRLARRYGRVVRLKGGDPSVFGRLEEELAALAAHGIVGDVVPGVTAASAAAAAAQRPLTRRGHGRSVLLRTGVTREGCVAGSDEPCAGPAQRRADTEAIYMAGARLATLGPSLLARGWPASTPVCVVSRAGWPDQLVSEHALADLGAAAMLHAGRPAIVIVGAGASAAVAKTLPAATRPVSVETPGA